MGTTTGQAFDALFELASSAAAFATAERDMRRWSQVEALDSALPALFQEQSYPEFTSKPNIPTIVKLTADLAIICNSTDTVKVPVGQLNAIVDALLTALLPSPEDDYRQTLGGLVYDCKPQGKGFYREATTANSRSYALIHVEIFVTM